MDLCSNPMFLSVLNLTRTLLNFGLYTNKNMGEKYGDSNQEEMY